MKKYFKKKFVLVPTILIFIMTFYGCKDLSFNNPNDPDLSNPPDVQRLVSGSESAMRIDLDIYLRVVETFGRNVYYFETADPRYTGELLTGPIDPGGFLVNRHWQARYRSVKTCEILINTYPDDLGATGYAKTIMAYQLLMLLNYTEANGIKIVFSEDVNTPFVSEADSYTEIERLLDEGYSDLTNANVGDEFSFKLSSGFSGLDTPAEFAKFNRAIKARVLVYQDKWDAALTALGNSFIDAGSDLDFGAYHAFTNGPGDLDNGTWEDPLSDGLKLFAHPSLKTDAETNTSGSLDARYSAKVQERSVKSFNNLTSTLAVTIVSNVFEKMAIIRNEELILLRAEANIGKGLLGEAETDINTVRAAAGLEDVDLNSMSNAQALDQLLYEKRYSLFMEGHRWIDMRHYQKLGNLPLDRSGDVVIERMPKPESEVAGS